MARKKVSEEAAAKPRRFYCDDATWELLHQNAYLCGKTLSAYLRDASSLQPRSRVFKPDQFMALTVMFDRLVDFANELSDSSCPTQSVVEILDHLAKIEKQLETLLPRYSHSAGHADRAS
jgi:hypothetical protein